jgi:3-hydroxy-3-methylglutaryl CoA synthase
MTGILAVGSYLPVRRLQRSSISAAIGWYNPAVAGVARGEKAIANWDEDSLTMAVEAARDCLVQPGSVPSRLWLASTTHRFSDRQNACVVKEALAYPDEVSTMDLAGSQRAGTSMLLGALESTVRSTLCVASDLRRTAPASELEMSYGDGAVAVLVGNERPIARFLGGRSHSVDLVDHYRQHADDFDVSWEARWTRDEGVGKVVAQTLKAALADLSLPADRVARVILPASIAGGASNLARSVGIASAVFADPLGSEVGDLGVSHSLFGLAHELEAASPGDILLLVGFGQGSDVLIFEVTDDIVARRPSAVSRARAHREADTNYIRYLAARNNVELVTGLRAERRVNQSLSAMYRHRKSVVGLVGGRDEETGRIYFPKSILGFSGQPAASGQIDYPLAPRPARIVSFTADRLAYCPDPPLYYGTIRFEGGGQMVADFTDVGSAGVAIDQVMRMMFRIKARNRKGDLPMYSWKAAPARVRG